ncbi:MAG TPA: hypothetical protein VIG47_05570, partial [Gemmatimonadaceae bacterium]
EIDNGLAPGAVTNAIREDPRKKGLLYAATETQVWVSFNDGDSWQSLRLDMPAVSVRDIQLKDDNNCMCSDLIAGTHGRGFWILDDVTPLRQEAAARSASTAYLFKPETALRIRLATNDPTPWPPEMPAGENPPNGAIIDYYLASSVSGPVTVDILDAGGKLVRTYTSELKRDTDPALDPAAYDKVCQSTPGAADCGVPLYWPSRTRSMPTSAGMHRISWNLRYQPMSETRGDVDATGAVPNRSSASPSSPWAPPGTYTVRLTVAGRSYTQPLTVRLDPRVKTPAAALALNTKLSLEMYELARSTRQAYGQAHDLGEKLAQLQKDQKVDVAAFKAQVDSVAPSEARGGRRFFGARGGGRPAITLNGASSAALAASLAMQSAETAPTAAQIAACARARTEAQAAMTRWNAMKTTGLSSFNAMLKTKGQPAVTLPAVRPPVALPSDVNGNVNENENDG